MEKIRFHPICLSTLALLIAFTGCTQPYAPSDAWRQQPVSSSSSSTIGTVGTVTLGALAGAGGLALLRASRSLILLGGLGGGVLAYYLQTGTSNIASNRRLETGVIVYQLGDYLGVDIPNYSLFIPDSAEFSFQAESILNEVIAILATHPMNNILIVGNTSGFDRLKREKILSTRRAKQVAFYLQSYGREHCTRPQNQCLMGRIAAVGYGNRLPIASDFHFVGISANSHIQITSYP